MQLLYCRNGKHTPQHRGYDAGFLIECKWCEKVLHSTFYDTD